MKTTVKLEGFKELDIELGQLGRQMGKPVLRRALKKAAEPMADKANKAAPVGPTGNLARSFTYGTKLNKRQSSLHRKLFRDERASVEGFVGTNDPAGVQQEFGNVRHGPQATLRPVWDQDKMALLDRLKVELRTEIDRAVARAARKAAKNRMR